MLQKWDSIASFNTFTYGSRQTRAITLERLDKDFVAQKVRTPGVIRAENELAKKLGITQHVSEEQLQTDRYTPESPATRFQGQEMTLSSFATPLNGLHRIDTYDGAIMMSSKMVTISSESHKRQIVDATLKNVTNGKGIDKQVTDLNSWL